MQTSAHKVATYTEANNVNNYYQLLDLYKREEYSNTVMEEVLEEVSLLIFPYDFEDNGGDNGSKTI